MCRQPHRKPECFPEQLLCNADGVPPERASAIVASWFEGQCAPHSSARLRQGRLGQHRARQHRHGLARPNAMRRPAPIALSPKPKASAAPLSTSGSAWIAFTAERGNTGWSMSPSASTALPVSSKTATAARMPALDEVRRAAPRREPDWPWRISADLERRFERVTQAQVVFRGAVEHVVDARQASLGFQHQPVGPVASGDAPTMYWMSTCVVPPAAIGPTRQTGGAPSGRPGCRSPDRTMLTIERGCPSPSGGLSPG